MSSNPRRLTRRPSDAKLGGVCAGIAEYTGVDITLVRVAWIVLSIWPGAVVLGVVAYVALWILMPTADSSTTEVAPSRRLLRSRSDRRIAGVCGGLADYFDLDSTIVRVVWVILTIVPCAIIFGVLAYIVAWLVIPSEPAATLQPSPSTP